MSGRRRAQATSNGSQISCWRSGMQCERRGIGEKRERGGLIGEPHHHVSFHVTKITQQNYLMDKYEWF